jgi:hypothetical protein
MSCAGSFTSEMLVEAALSCVGSLTCQLLVGWVTLGLLGLWFLFLTAR